MSKPQPNPFPHPNLNPTPNQVTLGAEVVLGDPLTLDNRWVPPRLTHPLTLSRLHGVCPLLSITRITPCAHILQVGPPGLQG